MDHEIGVSSPPQLYRQNQQLSLGFRGLRSRRVRIRIVGRAVPSPYGRILVGSLHAQRRGTVFMSEERVDQERPCLHCMMVELIDDFFAEYPARLADETKLILAKPMM